MLFYLESIKEMRVQWRYAKLNYEMDTDFCDTKQPPIRAKAC